MVKFAKKQVIQRADALLPPGYYMSRLRCEDLGRPNHTEPIPILTMDLERNVDPLTCLFCKIVSGEVTARLVFEDEISLAFLDHRPVFPGHCLLIPREHYETLTDLPDNLTGPFFKNAQRLARAVESAMEAHGTFVAMNNRVSQSVPHLHTHVVPRRRKDGLRGFFWPRYPYKSEEDADAVQSAIRTAMDDLIK